MSADDISPVAELARIATEWRTFVKANTDDGEPTIRLEDWDEKKTDHAIEALEWADALLPCEHLDEYTEQAFMTFCRDCGERTDI